MRDERVEREAEYDRESKKGHGGGAQVGAPFGCVGQRGREVRTAEGAALGWDGAALQAQP